METTRRVSALKTHIIGSTASETPSSSPSSRYTLKKL
jgi:hypothetical protein